MTTNIQREWLFGTMREPPGVDVGRSVVAKNATLFENPREPLLRRQRSEEDIAHAKRLFVRQGMFAKKENQSETLPKPRGKSPLSKIRLTTTGQPCYHPHLDVIRARIAMSPYTTKYKSDYTEEVLDLMNKTNLMSEAGAAGEYQISELTKEEINSKFEKIRTHIHPFSHVNTYKDPVSTVYNHRFPISPERIETVREQKEARRVQEEKEKQRKAIAHDKVLRNASCDLHLAESFFSLPNDRVNISQFIHDTDRIYLKLGASSASNLMKTTTSTTTSTKPRPRPTSAKLSQSKSMAIASRIIEEANKAASKTAVETTRSSAVSTTAIDSVAGDERMIDAEGEDNVVASFVANAIKIATLTVAGDESMIDAEVKDNSVAAFVANVIKIATLTVAGEHSSTVQPPNSKESTMLQKGDQQQPKTVLKSPHAMDDIERSYLRLGPPTINPPGPPTLLANKSSIHTAVVSAVASEKRSRKLRPVSAGALATHTWTGNEKWNHVTRTSSLSNSKPVETANGGTFQENEFQETTPEMMNPVHPVVVARIPSNLTVDIESHHDERDSIPPLTNDTTGFVYAQYPRTNADNADMSKEELVDSLADFFAQKRSIRRSSLSNRVPCKPANEISLEKGPTLQPLTPIAGPTFGIVTPLLGPAPAHHIVNGAINQQHQHLDVFGDSVGYKGMTSADRLRVSTARASRPSSALPATASSLRWQGPPGLGPGVKKKSSRDKRFVPHLPRQRVDII